MRRPLSLLFLWAIHGVAVYYLVREIGPGGFALVLLPTTLIAWYGGLRWGLVGGLTGITINSLVSNLIDGGVFDPLIALHQGGWVGIIVTLFVVAVVGYLRDLRMRLGRSERELQTLNGQLEQRVEERTEALSEVNAELQHTAFHDTLTGLANRALFLDRLAHVLERSKRAQAGPFAVLYLDFDRFKAVNDSLGHHVGDELLVAVSKRLRSVVRPTDTVARLGGDEFILLLEDLSSEDEAVAAAQRVQSVLASAHKLHEHDVHLTASIGVVTNSPDYTRAAEIMRDADIAMYRAKEKGRACFSVFDRAMREHLERRMSLEADLRVAVQSGDFEVHYQPILSLQTGEVESVEALVRWTHPVHGTVSPAVFVPIAEEMGLVTKLDRWVLRRALQQFAAWGAERDTQIGLNVNVSSQGFLRPGLVAYVREVLAETGVAAQRLRLELTETMIVDASDEVKATLQGLSELGVQLHIDDFGTGYSSLSYLQDFPLDVLKIDRAFINKLFEAKGEALVRTIILMAHTLGLSVVAEGIETSEQRARLRDLGCECAQGYLFAKPLHAQEVTAFIARQGEKADSVA